MTKVIFALALSTSYLILSAIPTIAQTDTDFAGVITNEYSQLNELRPSHLVSGSINFILGGAGVLSLLFLLWGGVSWIMSGGDKDGIDRARKKITAALIGVSLVFSSYALLFVVRTLFGVNLIQVDLAPIESVGTTGGGPGPGSGSSACGCYNGGCAAIGQVGPLSLGGPCYQCTSAGWQASGGSCGPITCGSCP